MKIGELADKTGMASSAIRYYEQSGLLPKPERGANGYRDYSEAAVERLRRIQMAQSLGFSLEAIRSVFASHEELSKDDLLRKLDGRLQEIEQLMDTLREQQQHLRSLRTTLRETWAEGECLNTASLINGKLAKPGKQGKH
ncbi:DNA-binding transcriptional regulator, MerR family [Collimonas sp. OK242]|jgi:DNA-binding transcriptional MerR regulator|uniref:MerR family transcriptional regulator n=1 Tax=Collimonas sp. OK242 TaxID=1798195 RepID=UPI000896280F|nr:MerR family transcriptional regulator [Collimonas sp. OK242]SDY60346.1 DNA-binding transcriptional regulator, MerR family [Collimonas sp. OK242]